MTRLLNTPIIGSTTKIVPSSWIEMLAGLSRWVMRSIPPDFCAEASGAAARDRKCNTRKQAVSPALSPDDFQNAAHAAGSGQGLAWQGLPDTCSGASCRQAF